MSELDLDNFFYLTEFECPPLAFNGVYQQLVSYVVAAEVALAEDRGLENAWVWITPESFEC